MKNKDFNNSGKTANSNSSGNKNIDVSKGGKQTSKRDEYFDSEINSQNAASGDMDNEAPVTRPTKQWDKKSREQNVDQETGVPSKRTQSTDSSGSIDEGFADAELDTKSSTEDEDEIMHLPDEDLENQDQDDVDGDKRSY